MVNKGKLRQFHAAFAGGFGSLVWGLVTTWPSYTSEVYSSNTTTILTVPMTKFEDSLLGSLPSLGAMAGTAVAGFILDTFGRRNGGLLISLPYLISWTIIGISKSINVILAARFLAGISGGGCLIMVPILVSEVAEDSIRGALVSVSMLQYCMGALISYILGWLLTYRTIIWTNIAFSVVTILLILFMEESPVYLLRKNKEQDARISLAKYRGVSVSSTKVQEELYILKQQLSPAVELKSFTDTMEKAEEAENLNPQASLPIEKQLVSSFKMLFFSPSSRKAFMVLTTIITMQIFMGMLSVQVYASTVFTETDPTRSELYTVVFAIVQFLGSLVTAVTADKFGRRVLQIGSSTMVGICLAGLGYFLQFRVAPAWVTVVLIMTFCFFFILGPGSVPYVLLAEVFVPEVLNLASLVIIEWVWLMNFCLIAVFPYITDFIGICGAFYGFAIISFTNAIISYVIMPETAGLSNEQIQELFSPMKKK